LGDSWLNYYIIVRKLLQVFSLIGVMLIVVYFAFRIMPGNPALLLFHDYHSNRPLTLAQKEQILDATGLAYGKYSLKGFSIYVYDMLTFNYGIDYSAIDLTVAQEIALALPYTLVLIGLTSIFSFVIGVPFGITISKWRNSRKESAVLGTSLIITSIPYFILALLLIFLLGVYLNLLPVQSNVDPLVLYQITIPHLLQLARAIALPFLSLLVLGATGHMITMRAAMVSTLGEDHINTAIAKGVPSKKVLRKHAARIAVIPVTTRMALELSGLMGGALIVSIIFNWPGMGPLLFNAVLNEDYPMSEAVTFIISLTTILAYAMVDFIHAALDPRIKL
jgi:peptide/nickel transport system permease protein